MRLATACTAAAIADAAGAAGDAETRVRADAARTVTETRRIAIHAGLRSIELLDRRASPKIAEAPCAITRIGDALAIPFRIAPIGAGNAGATGGPGLTKNLRPCATAHHDDCQREESFLHLIPPYFKQPVSRDRTKHRECYAGAGMARA
jgi:hypothetical protein